MTGNVFGVCGLIIHLAILGLTIFALASFHSHILQGPLREPAAYSVQWRPEHLGLMQH